MTRTPKDYYRILEEPYTNIIAAARPVDPDNGGTGSYEMAMGSSDVLGIVMALEREGYAIKRKPWWMPWFVWGRP